MTESIIILLLLLLNGLFAMCEIALVSSRKSRLEQKAQAGSKGARIALKLLQEPEKFLSTVQIGITLVGIVAGAYGGNAFAQDLQPHLERLEFTQHYSHEAAFILTVTIITYLSLVIGELAPKTIALNNPEIITIRFASFMQVLSVSTYPIVVFLSSSTRILLKILFIKEKKDVSISEEELKYMIQTGSQQGILEKKEGEIMHQVFKLGELRVGQIMIHNHDIVWLDAGMSYQEIYSTIQKYHYTKYPVCEGSLDKISGILSIRELAIHAQDPTLRLQDHLTVPSYFHTSATLLNVLEDFRHKKTHIGIVVNEFGITEGLITLHDVVEKLIGTLPEIRDEPTPTFTKRSDNSYLVDGDLAISDFKQLIEHTILPEEHTYHTLAGFIIQRLQHIPQTGDSFQYQNFRFEILDMDGKRIDKVLIERLG